MPHTPEEDGWDPNRRWITSEPVKWPPPSSEMEDDIKREKGKGDSGSKARALEGATADRIIGP